MNVTVFSKKNCPQCTATKRKMDKENVPYIEIAIDEDPQALEHVRSMGYQQAPVVTVGDQHWSGFRPDRIASVARMLAATA